MKQLAGLGLCILVGGFIGGCAQHRPAVESVQQARLAIREAELAKAQELAAMDLYSSREKLEKAEKLEKENPDQAWRYAEEAKVDAEVAMYKAKKTSTEKSYESAQQNIDSVSKALKKNR